MEGMALFVQETKGENDQLYMKIQMCLLTVPKQPLCTALQDYVQNHWCC